MTSSGQVGHQSPRPVPDFASKPYLEPVSLLPESHADAAYYGRPADRPEPPGDDGGPTRVAWLVGAIGLLACLGLALYAFALRGDGDDAAAPLAIDGSGTTAPPAAPTDAETGVAGDTSSTTIEREDGTVLLPSSDTDLTGTMVDGKILVAGAVPSTQAQAGLVLLLEEVVGMGNVDTENLTIDPVAPTPDRIALIVGSEVVFSVGSEEVEGEFEPVLDNLADILTAKPEVTAVVEGHADNQGNASENFSLSQRRADAVVDYLAGRGVERFRLVAIGRGSDEPVADNDTDEGRARNRRIEFVVVGFRLDL